MHSVFWVWEGALNTSFPHLPLICIGKSLSGTASSSFKTPWRSFFQPHLASPFAIPVIRAKFLLSTEDLGSASVVAVFN